MKTVVPPYLCGGCCSRGHPFHRDLLDRCLIAQRHHFQAPQKMVSSYFPKLVYRSVTNVGLIVVLLAATVIILLKFLLRVLHRLPFHLPCANEHPLRVHSLIALQIMWRYILFPPYPLLLLLHVPLDIHIIEGWHTQPIRMEERPNNGINELPSNEFVHMPRSMSGEIQVSIGSPP